MRLQNDYHIYHDARQIKLRVHLRDPEDPDIMFPKAPCPFTAANSDAACVCVYFPGRRSC